MNRRAWTYLVVGAAAALVLTTCSGCATRGPIGEPVVRVHVSDAALSALLTLHAATTGTPTGNEVGLCLTGARYKNVIHVTGVAVPPVQLGNTRTSVFILSCEGVSNVVGRAHFHPWADHRGQCHRSETDRRTHRVLAFPADVVVCEGQARWYSVNASGIV